jgi:A/G-specific adenine glycosylase
MRVSPQKIAKFKKEVWDFYKKEARVMPWRITRDPYRIVVSEVMLQQTQVSRVFPKYKEFIKAFPTFTTLADAPNAKVLKVWSGMGYNRRALYLKALSRIVVDRYSGRLPDDPKTLMEFPAIGSATAGSIAAFSYNKPTVFIETNIRRTFIHFFFSNKTRVDDKEILLLVAQTVDKKNPREWYFALMDYGAMLAKQVENPNRKSKHYVKQKAFEGSDRKIRGEVLRILLGSRSVTKKGLCNRLKLDSLKGELILSALMREGFLTKVKGKYQLQ